MVFFTTPESRTAPEIFLISWISEPKKRITKILLPWALGFVILVHLAMADAVAVADPVLNEVGAEGAASPIRQRPTLSKSN